MTQFCQISNFSSTGEQSAKRGDFLQRLTEKWWVFILYTIYMQEKVWGEITLTGAAVFWKKFVSNLVSSIKAYQ